MQLEIVIKYVNAKQLKEIKKIVNKYEQSDYFVGNNANQTLLKEIKIIVPNRDINITEWNPPTLSIEVKTNIGLW